jgi:hypothetical protein
LPRWSAQAEAEAPATDGWCSGGARRLPLCWEPYPLLRWVSAVSGQRRRQAAGRRVLAASCQLSREWLHKVFCVSDSPISRSPGQRRL